MLVTGCETDPSKGWVLGTTYSTDIKTIAIPVVQNDTFDREVGYLLTNALIREVETRTPWRVTGETVADTLLDVTITDVKLRALSQSRLTKLDQEVAVQLTVDWNWERMDDSSTIAGWEGMGTAGMFFPSNPLGEPIELGRLQSVELMARAIVDRMAESW
ncbi:MAG: LPS assembly lipoprotein LptE [Phycisphaerales bacterium]|jgi:hypothetical protein|nr:hypothetical protein [Planctomycetaceae bacterium]MDP7573990.1 LPS assembly lipoprotein LptE [Phycisphaerales bacterium]|tara:strand:- start:187 stop:666 length:480 start_codon:yes stop_codon:yes gene_type:complete